VPEAIIVPGVVAVEPEPWSGRAPAVIVRGPLAGYARLPEITDWKSVYLFARREAAERLAVPTMAPSVDLDAYPHVRAQLARSRLVVIEEGEASRFAAVGELLIELSYHRVAGGGGLVVSGAAVDRGFSCEDPELVSLAWGVGDGDEETFEEVWEGDPVPRLYDAILRAMTEGEVSLLDVDLALSCDGLYGDPSSFEREFVEVAARGEAQVAAAEELLSLLDAAEGESVALPGLGLARRVVRPAFTLSKADGTWTWSGPPLEVPAESYWVVDEVDEFVPAERARRSELFRAKLAARRAQAQRRKRWVRRALLVVVVLVVLIVVLSRDGS
jgi:hypothetical protein